MIVMTQDQYGQARGSGYVVRGDVAPENEAEDVRSEESKPKTTFQKVASALRGDKEPDQREADPGQPAANRVTTSSEDASGSDVMAPGSDRAAASPPYVTERDEAAMANTPISQQAEGTDVPRRDYWDEPDGSQADNEAVEVTSPDPVATDRTAKRGRSARQTDQDAMGHPATDPDMFGTGRAGDETAGMPAAAAEQPGAATIADVPAAGTPATAAPAGDVPAATDAEATGSSGRHAAAATSAGAAATPGNGELRPGEAADPGLRPGETAGKLGDFSDLTYGNLVPDAEQFNAQWQEIQFRFVDDPRGSVTEAAEIVAQVTAKMEAAIQERQRAIEERQHAIQEQQRSLRGRWGEDTNADTEALRETLRMYKTFLDQLIGSRTS
jgi:hypothetical protein